MATATRWFRFFPHGRSIAVLVLVFLQCTTANDSKLITSTLDAKWKAAPLILEASEYIAKESNEKFWKFIELSKHADLIQTERDKYNFILKNAGEILTPVTLNLLKFALSVRFYSPRVELYMKVAEQLSPPNCNVFVAIGDKLICDVKETVKLIESSDKVTSSQEKIEHEHYYPNSDGNPVTVILYGEIGTSEFYTTHQQLVKFANKGKVHYILRHFVKSLEDKKVRLSGYGVELAVKSTEYKAVDDSKVKDDAAGGNIKKTEEDEEEVEGFLFGKLRKLHPELKEELEQFKIHLKESSREIASLKVWQIQDLSFQAAQRVMSSEPQRALRVLRDLSQNLPTQTKSLVKTNVNDKMRKEIQENQKVFASLNLEPGDSALSINGIRLSVEDLQPFDLLQTLRDEGHVMDQLASLGIKGESLLGLASMAVQSDHDDYILDIRSESILYVNDLEKDSMYRSWPTNIQELLRPTFPGMLRYIAKNIFHVVFLLDPMDVGFKDMIQAIEDFLLQSMPARFGLVLVTNAAKDVDAKTNAAVAITRTFSFIYSEKEPRKAFDFLIQLYRAVPSNQVPTAKEVYDKFVSMYSRDDAEDVFGSDSEYDEWRKASKRFYDKTGFKTLPQVLVNGVPIKNEEFEILDEAISRELLMQTGPLQHAVYMGQLHQYQNVLDHIMSKPNVVKRLNHVIQRVDTPHVDLIGAAIKKGGDILHSVAEFSKLESAQMISIISKKMKYFTKKGEELSLKPITSWVVVNLASEDGRSLLEAALSQMKSSMSVRVGILHNPNISISSKMPELLSRAVEVVLDSKEYTSSAMLSFLDNLLNKGNNFSQLLSDSKAIMNIVKDIKGLKTESIEKGLEDKTMLERIRSHQLFCKRVLNINPGENAVITNGRVLGPLDKANIFSEEDFQLLEDFDMDLYARKVRNRIDDMTFPNLSADDDTSEFRSNIIMRASSVLLGRQKKQRSELKFTSSEHSLLSLKSDSDVKFDVVAILDPLTKDAQRLAPVLMVLQNVTDVDIRVLMNCREKHSEMPLNRFYRYVLEPQLTFDNKGFSNPGPLALFENMPQSPLLTMNMDTPLGWMVEAVRSPYDLDNIRLQEAEQGVHASFELEYIFIEGHCSDALTGQPPRGLQFTLGTKLNPDQFDTIVMANLGYFQLKAYPGAWVLQLREGKSSKIYEIESLTGGRRQEGSGNFTVIVDSFTGKLMKTKVKRKPGMERADLLSDDSDEAPGGLWESISSIVSSDKKKKSSEDETINIFSVASGHLYERFMRIMMISVLRNTKSPVKFWFLKNFLSPTFTAFLPYMAQHYGFEYELVQYQWPRWLHAQTEKQRIIWGYKILFLDVLFPLHINRIIFVDADLIVRTDLKELNDMDLNGAPYAYTPFCDSRTEMDGFRFWKQGYWRSHLGYRPYHISALYVVDLKRFRSIAAGDRLRGQYQGLSQDPNSLANLDQDLPNNMIHQVPIKSLPQEWLWCETWCDDYSKQFAKTIDLCNNPMTKEPKLERAKRIIKNWPEYDNEIRRLQEQYAEKLASYPQQKITEQETKAHVEL